MDGISRRADGTGEAIYAQVPAWHGLGEVREHAMTSAECLEVDGLNALIVPQKMARWNGSAWIEVPEAFSNVRTDTDSVLGVVGKQFVICQNVEAFSFMDKLVMDGIMKYEAALALSGGKKVVIVARMPETDEIVDGDELKRYILFVNAHDGSSAIRVLPTSIRVVCMNTLRLALGIAQKNEVLSIRHSGDIDKKLDEARTMLGIASRQFARFTEIGRKLTTVEITRDGWNDYLDGILPLPDKDKKRARQNTEDARVDVSARFFNGKAQQLPGIRRTWWAGVNAVTEHVDHSAPKRKVNNETRWQTTTFGTGNDLKQRALATAVEMAG